MGIDLNKILEVLEKILIIEGKVNKLFALGQALAKLANAHRKIMEEEYPNLLPPDLAKDFEAILKDDVVPETKPDPQPPETPT